MNCSGFQFDLIVACTVKCGHGWQLPGRIWPDHRIVIVRGGCGELAHGGRSHRLRRGSVVFGLPGESYALRQDPRKRLVISVLRFQARTETGRKLVLAAYRPAICMQPRCFPLLEQLALRQTRSVPRVPATAQGLNASLLLSLLWLMREDQAGEENLAASSLAYQDLKPALEHLETAGATGLNIAALARMCGLSTGTFSRRMQECFKESPKHFVLRARIDRAKSMLLESAYTIEAIADALDYSEPAHFSRQFKKYTGVPPTAFRTSHQ